VGFDLSLGKSHIAALVYIDQVRLAGWDSARVNYTDRTYDGFNLVRRPFQQFVSGSRGIQERGLVIHTEPTERQRKKWRELADAQEQLDGFWHFYWEPKTWRITKAGQLVIKLLQEAGIYQEYASVLDIREEKAS
jgi:hypothetical protein